MDQLQNLPPKETQNTPQEESIASRFFGTSSESLKGKLPTNSSKISKINWKFLGFSALAFAGLANPWIDQVLCKVPYCDESPTTVFLLKVVIFFLILVLLQMYM